MRFRTILSCLVVILALAVIIPANVIAADQEKTANSDIFAAAGIKSGDTFTIYYDNERSVSKIVKGTPKGITINTLNSKFSVSPKSSPDRYTISSPIDQYDYDRGSVAYTTTHIYYDAWVSPGCSIAFGAYNVSGNYFTGQYYGPYSVDTHKYINFTMPSSNWKYQVYNGGPDTLYITGSAYIYY